MVKFLTLFSFFAFLQELRSGADNSLSAVKSAQSLEIDGRTVELTAFNIGGSNFFGLRALSGYLGYEVGYRDFARNEKHQLRRPHYTPARSRRIR